MNSHALNVLEFPRVLDVVAGRASSELGAERVRSLRPTTDRSWIEREHSRIAAVRTVTTSDQGWTTVAIPNAREAIARLGVQSAVLSGTDLLLLATLLRSSRRIFRSWGDASSLTLPSSSMALVIVDSTDCSSASA